MWYVTIDVAGHGVCRPVSTDLAPRFLEAPPMKWLDDVDADGDVEVVLWTYEMPYDWEDEELIGVGAGPPEPGDFLLVPHVYELVGQELVLSPGSARRLMARMADAYADARDYDANRAYCQGDVTCLATVAANERATQGFRVLADDSRACAIE